MRLNCLIVDDEPAGRRIIEEYIQETTFLNLVGKVENPLKTFEILENAQIDLMYLDIQMPKINGIDFLRGLKNPPMVILTTAFSEYAIEGFELDVIDYLLKPISMERFLKASNKALDFHKIRNTSTQKSDFFFVKSNNKFEKISYDELLFIEAANNYVILHTKNRKIISYITLKGIADILPSEKFIKVHKSFIVALDKIENLDTEEIKILNHSIPISRNLKSEIMERILKSNLVSR